MRVVKWVCMIGILAWVAVFTLRQVGLPLPDVTHVTTINGRITDTLSSLIGRRCSSTYSNGLVKARTLYRGRSVDLRLVSGQYYDSSGRLRSQVTGGNGVAVYFYDKGTPAAIECYREGVICGSCLHWSPDGALILDAYIDAGGKVVWRRSKKGPFDLLSPQVPGDQAN